MRNSGLRSRDNHFRYNLRCHFYDASYYDRGSRNPRRCRGASHQQSSEQPSNDTKFDGYEVHTSEYTATPAAPKKWLYTRTSPLQALR